MELTELLGFVINLQKSELVPTQDCVPFIQVQAGSGLGSTDRREMEENSTKNSSHDLTEKVYSKRVAVSNWTTDINRENSHHGLDCSIK